MPRVRPFSLRSAILAALFGVVFVLAGPVLGAEHTLYWTAPAENGTTGGAAAAYDLRYATAPADGDTAAWWGAATAAAGEPTPGLPGAVESHTVTGLAPATTYYFAIRSVDEAGNLSALSNLLAYTTEDTTSTDPDPDPDPLVISGVGVESIGADSAYVVWTTNLAAYGFVRYGTTASYGEETYISPSATKGHGVWLAGLGEGETIHYQVVSFFGAERDSSADASFVTFDPPPARPTGIDHVDGTGSVAVLWEPNTDPDLDHYTIYWEPRGRSDTGRPLEEDFDALADGTDPAGWALERDDGTAADVFTVISFTGHGKVYRGTADGNGYRARYAPPSPSFADFEWTGALRFDEGAGADLELRRGGSAAYRIGFTPGGTLRAEVVGGAPFVSEFVSPYDGAPGVWHRFRVSVWNRPDGALLRGVFWPDGAAEPARPTLTARGAAPLPPASVALRAAGTGSAWFDDLVVTALPPSSSGVDRSGFLFWSQTGLSSDSSYHYVLEAIDDAGGASLPAGPVIGLPLGEGETDSIPPARVTDLVASAPAEVVFLRWTAPGDDSLTGRALSYDLRWSPSPIDPETWPAGTTKLYTGTPRQAGSDESYSYGGFAAGSTAYFALTAEDEAGNVSSLSNTASVTIPADTTAPTLSNIRVQNVTDVTAQIAWSTDETSDGTVSYGLTDGYELGSVSQSGTGTNHVVTLSGLAAATTYHYRVRSADGSGNASTSTDRTFTTDEAASGDPVISGLSVVSLADTSAVIRFETDVTCYGFADWGLDAGYGETASAPGPGTEHVVTLAPLTPGVTYHFRARASAVGGGGASTEDQTLTTAFEQTPPVISSVEVTDIGTAGATIVWHTDEGATGRVEYGLGAAYGAWTTGDTSYSFVHEERIDGLAAGTLFHFRIHSVDRYANASVSGDLTFTTLEGGDHQAPALLGIAVDTVHATGATIVWQTDEASDGQVEYGPSLPYAYATPLADALVADHVVAIAGLQASTTYHFRVLSRDGSGNLAASGDHTLTTPSGGGEPALPVVSDITVRDESATGITVGWRTDRAALGQVEYGPNGSFGFYSAPEPTADTTHAVRIEGLTAGVAFSYRVLAWQTGGPVAVSETGTFTLDPGSDVEGPVIDSLRVLSVGDESAEIGWVTDEPSDAQVEYGLTDDYDRATRVDTARTTAHAARIDGLAPHTTYHFRVASRDRAGNVSYSEDRRFTTTGDVDVTPPVVSGLAVADLGGGAVRVTYSTDEPAVGHVDYGLDESLGLETEPGHSYAVLHGFDVSGLAAGVRFYFRASVEDPSGNTAYSEVVVHTVGADPDTIPPVFSGEVVVQPGIHDATIFWATEGPCRGTVEFGTDSTSLLSYVNEAGFSIVHRIDLAGLDAETRYHFRVSAVDLSGNHTSLVGEPFVTNADTVVAPPVFLSVEATEIASSAATIEWTTDRVAVGQVEYGRGGTLDRATAMTSSFSSSHADRLADLRPGTTYTFRVRGMSPEGVFFFSEPDSFTTAEDLTGPPAPRMHVASEIEEGVQVSWASEESEVPHSLVLKRRFLPGGDWKTIWIAAGAETTYVDAFEYVDLAGVEKAQYFIEAFDEYGNGTPGDTIEVEIEMHAAPSVPTFQVLPNRPNPFNPTTTIPFELPSQPNEPHLVTLTVYNLAGERVKTLVDAIFPAGTRSEVTWDGTDFRGSDVGSGVYYYRFTVGTYVETRRMTLIR